MTNLYGKDDNMNNQITDKLWFKECLAHTSLVEKLKAIKLIVSDIDGSLTDGYMEYTAQEESSRRFSIVDGMAMAHAAKIGLPIALVTGKKHHSAHVRAEKLKIPDELCFEGHKDKKIIIQTLLSKYNLIANQIVLFGDDYFDAIVKVEMPSIVFASPCNAPFYFQDLADVIIPRQSNNHSFRLLLDLILYLQKKHFAQEIIDASSTR
jgi:3-deoxy-D-manno-octulosonate 8-phosphate phosphatase (KDO 8-P phosphatase)